MADNLDLLSSKFVFENTMQYSLSIRHQPDGYSFSVKDDNGIVVAVKHLVSEKNYIPDNDPLLNLNFNKVTYIESGAFALIPVSLFSPEHAKIFMPLEKDKLSISNIRHCSIPDNILMDNSLIAFVSNDKQLPQQIKSRLSKDLNTEFSHDALLLIKMAAMIDEHSFVLCELMAGKLIVLAVNNAKISAITSYSVNTELDMLYYVMEMYRVLNFNPEQVKLFISGELTLFSFRNIVKDFVRFHDVITPKNISDDISLPNPEYFSLISYCD